MGKVVAILLLAVAANAQYYPPSGGSAPSGGAIGGASNCAALNGVPYVTSAGVFTCDTSKISLNPSTGVLAIGLTVLNGITGHSAMGGASVENSPISSILNLGESFTSPALTFIRGINNAIDWTPSADGTGTAVKGMESYVSTGGANNLGTVIGHDTSVDIYSTGSIAQARGASFGVFNEDAAHVALAEGVFSQVNVFAGIIDKASAVTGWIGNYGGSLPIAYDFWAQAPSGGGSALVDFFGFYSDAVGGVGTRAYPFWADEQGVYRIRADNTFDAVYQAIPALYNPQFTKYTPGAANYERIVQQWNGNVAEIGTEKGGTGTLRPVRFIGPSIESVAYRTATNCSDSAGAAACGSAAAGSVVIDAGATTVVVSTTAVTANSEVIPVFDSSLGTRLGVTCNTGIALPAITARTAGTSFTVTVAVAPITNPACFSYSIVN